MNSLEHICAVAFEKTGIRDIRPDMAIEQDLQMCGDDVTEFAQTLADHYGQWVWTWPWQRFAQLDEGLSLFFPFMLAWQLATWPFRGRFSYPSPYRRLTLDHIARVIDKDEWFDP